MPGQIFDTMFMENARPPTSPSRVNRSGNVTRSNRTGFARWSITIGATIGYSPSACFSTKARRTEAVSCGWSASRKIAPPRLCGTTWHARRSQAGVVIAHSCFDRTCLSALPMFVFDDGSHSSHFTAYSTCSVFAPVTTTTGESPACRAVFATARTNGSPFQSSNCLG